MLCSVIIANRNDFISLCVTIRSALEELKPIGGGEVIVVDSSDPDIYKALSEGSMVSKVYMDKGELRVFRQDWQCLFTAREKAIREAKGKYVICLDSHMLVGHNLIRDLVEFMERRDSDPKIAFAHAPLNWAHHHESRKRHDRHMNLDEIASKKHAAWGVYHRHERRISWKGMPWICRRSTFFDKLNGYGALSQHRLSWPGDPHLGIKPWLLGYENWAVPCSPGIHLGPFPAKAMKMHKYRVYTGKTGTHDGHISSMVSSYILGGEEFLRKYGWVMYRSMAGDPKEVLKAKFDMKIRKHLDLVKELAKDELEWMESYRTMSMDELLTRKPWND